MEQDANENQAAASGLSVLTGSNWHVWHVESQMIAAESLEAAIAHHQWDFAMERNDMTWDDKHCDRGEFLRDEGDEDPISLRAEAENRISKGETLPFLVAVEI